MNDHSNQLINRKSFYQNDECNFQKFLSPPAFNLMSNKCLFYECSSVIPRGYLVLYYKLTATDCVKYSFGAKNFFLKITVVILSVDFAKKDYFYFLETLVGESVDIHCMHI